MEKASFHCDHLLLSGDIPLSERAKGDLLLVTDGYYPLLGVRIIAPGCGSGVMTTEGWCVESRGVFQLH